MANRRNGNGVNSVPPFPAARGSNPEDNVFPAGWVGVWLSISLALPFVVAPLFGFLVPEGPEADSVWWRKSMVYRLDVRSFWDSNNDGIGDLAGVRARLSELQSAGVGAVWLSNLYSDAHGMEIIDPRLGTMDDLQALISDLHNRGMRIVLDFVPNHTSDKHVKFEASRRGDPTYINYYVWHDGSVTSGGTKQPPNNWIGQDGGSAWTYDEVRGEFYLHLQSRNHPDLNYRNPAVQEYTKGILTSWLQRDVDGFVALAAHNLVEADLTLDEPPSFMEVNKDDQRSLNHVYTQHQPETRDVIQSWADVIASFNGDVLDNHRLLVAEVQDSVFSTDWVQWSKYYDTRVDMPLNYQAMKLFRPDCDCLCMAGVIRVANWSVPEFRTMNWVLQTPVTGLDSTRYTLVSVLHMVLPGTPILHETQTTLGSPGKHDSMVATFGTPRHRAMLHALSKLRLAQGFVRGKLEFGLTNRDVFTVVRHASGMLIPRFITVLNLGQGAIRENFAVKVGKVKVPEMGHVVFDTNSEDFNVKYDVNMTSLLVKPGQGIVIQFK